MLPQPNWPEGHQEKATALLEQLAKDERFFMLRLPWASGIAVLVRRPPQACA